jgi:stage IV sporulation protein FB
VNDTFNNDQQANASPSGFPPKPVVVEKNQNAFVRSLISLFIYGVLFYFLFDNNIAYIAAILLVLIIHEMGHFLFMKIFNYSNVKIFIIPLLGAFTSGKKQKVSQWELSLIILGGPVPGIIIGCILYWFNKDLHHPTLTMLTNSFLIINLLNCLPFYPLDGGRLIETLFFKENYIIRLVFGIISIIALLVLCIVLFNPILLIIPFFIGLELYNENKHEKIREYLRQEHINYRTDYPSLPDKDYWLIRDCLVLSFPKKYAAVPAGSYQYSVVEPVIVQHINAVLQVNLIADLNLVKRLLMLLFYVAVIVGPILFIIVTRY